MPRIRPFASPAAGTAVAIAVASMMSVASAQIRRTAPDAAKVPMSVDLKLGSDAIAATGTGQCTHAPQASIYDVRSQMWTARHEGTGGKAVQLTLWKPMDGSAEMFTLSAGPVTVSTVRGGQPSGSGTVKFEAAGRGGAFRIDAKSADGRAISGVIKCDAFTPHIAEGG